MSEDREEGRAIAEGIDKLTQVIADKEQPPLNLHLDVSMKGIESKLDAIVSIMLDVAETLKRAAEFDRQK